MPKRKVFGLFCCDSKGKVWDFFGCDLFYAVQSFVTLISMKCTWQRAYFALWYFFHFVLLSIIRQEAYSSNELSSFKDLMLRSLEERKGEIFGYFFNLRNWQHYSIIAVNIPLKNNKTHNKIVLELD